MSVDKGAVEAWLLELLPHVMASGALHFAENRAEFVGSQASLSSHFTSAAASFMQYRGGYEIDDLIERLNSEPIRSTSAGSES